MSLFDGYTPPTDAELLAAVNKVLTQPRPYKWHPHDDFEPPAPDWSDYGHEGADRLEARETNWREGNS